MHTQRLNWIDIVIQGVASGVIFDESAESDLIWWWENAQVYLDMISVSYEEQLSSAFTLSHYISISLQSFWVRSLLVRAASCPDTFSCHDSAHPSSTQLSAHKSCLVRSSDPRCGIRIIEFGARRRSSASLTLWPKLEDLWLNLTISVSSVCSVIDSSGLLILLCCRIKLNDQQNNTVSRWM